MSQKYVDQISQWTIDQKSMLNEEKSKVMIINFLKNYHFSTRIKMNGSLLEIVKETKIVGLILSQHQ